jgi:lysozyme
MGDPACIDISHWQNFPDFEKVRAAGVVACIMKATEGTSYIDPNRAQNYINATKVGIACCTYHWLKPGNAKEQIQFYLDTIDPVPGERMVIDYEEDGCTLDDLHEAVRALLDDPRKLQVTVYSGHLLKEQLGDTHDDLLAKHTDLWLAQYTSGTPTWPEALIRNGRSGNIRKKVKWTASMAAKLILTGSTEAIPNLSAGSHRPNRSEGGVPCPRIESP